MPDACLFATCPHSNDWVVSLVHSIRGVEMGRKARHRKRQLAPTILRIPTLAASTPIPDLLAALGQCDRYESLLAYTRYRHAEQIHSRTACACSDDDERYLDDHANTAVRLSAARRISPTAADIMLTEAIALVHRIPHIGECLHDGAITPRQFQRLVIFTDLIDGEAYADDVDTAIASALRRHGIWSDRRLRDLAERIICRHDPDAVRRRHEQAKNDRNAGSHPLADGMAELGITATAEDVLLAMAAVNALAASVCRHDPRTKKARRSDAAISKLQDVPFSCQCDRDDCAAATNEQDLSDRHARIVMHVICQETTLNQHGLVATAMRPESVPSPEATTPPESATPPESGPPTVPGGSDHPGFLDGHGLISADHVRDIAARPDTVIRPINPSSGHALSTHQPSNPYRFSAALDTFIRARDGYCVFPGCNRPAWASDIDHVAEYNHHNPEDGGETSAVNGNVKCRFHHIVKTFGDWLDDQHIGADGLTHTTFTSPDGFTVQASGHTNEALFPDLASIRFQTPPRVPAKTTASTTTTPNTCASPRAGPQRRQTRVVNKHARRRYERKLNRQDREARCHGLPIDPPF